jgi:hypothetical protein
MSLLTQFLKSIGVKSIDQLTPEELLTYKDWESSLNGRQITSEEVRQFLSVELEDATAKLITKSLGEREDIFLKMKVDFIRKLTGFLDAPAMERKHVENLIKNQI